MLCLALLLVAFAFSGCNSQTRIITSYRAQTGVSCTWDGVTDNACVGKPPTGGLLSGTSWQVNGCPTIPDCASRTVVGQEVVFTPFTASSTTPNDSNWLVLTNFVNFTGPGPRPGADTIIGVQVKFKVSFDVNGQIPIGGVSIVSPVNGKLVNHTVPFPSSLYRSTAPNNGSPVVQTLCFPGPNADTCDRDNYLWEGTTFGTPFTFALNFSTVPFANMGVAIQTRDSKGGGTSHFINDVSLTITWVQGIIVPPTTGPIAPNITTTSPPFNPLGAIIAGAVVGGLLLIAGLILLIFLIRRKAMQAPTRRLDAPLETAYHSL